MSSYSPNLQSPDRTLRDGGVSPSSPLTAEDIKALVASLQDITGALAAADPADKAKVYAEMGIDITYHQDGRIVVESRPGVVESSVGERTLLPRSGRIPNRAVSSHFGTSKTVRNRGVPSRD